jgi:hypothetical protein
MDHCPWLDPQKCDGRNSTTPVKYKSHGVTYDTESGQVYMERTVRVKKKPKTNWINEYKTPALVKRHRPNREGAASLFDMARVKVAREMGNLTADHLEGMPLSIGRKVWDEVEARYEFPFAIECIS